MEEGSVSSVSCLHTETEQQLRNCANDGKRFLAIIFSHQQELSYQLHVYMYALHCTVTAFCSRAHDTKLAFILIPAMTCSYMPCSYSSHVLLVGYLGGSTEPLDPPRAMGL